MFRCPKCGAPNLEITVEVWAHLIQTFDACENETETEPTFETDTDAALDHDHEWTGNSPMHCMDCAHFDIADEFKTKESPSNAEQESEIEHARRLA